MTMAWLKAVALAFLLLLPTVSSSGAQEPPPGDKAPQHGDREIVVEDERVVALDDDEPVVIRSGHHARHGFLGVRLIDITPELRAHFGAPRDAGILIGEVEPDSPAAVAGIQVGDVLTKVDGDKVESSSELSRKIRRRKGGETVKIEVERARAAKTLTVTLQERRAKELDLGELRRRVGDRDWAMRDFHIELPRIELPETLDKLQQKLKDLDKRLRDLEKKIR